MALPPEISGSQSVEIQLSVFLEPMSEVASADSLVQDFCGSDLIDSQSLNPSSGCTVNTSSYTIKNSDSAYLVTYTPI